MPPRTLQPDEDASAFVVKSRPYPASDVLTALIRHRMSVTERAATDETLETLRQVQPDLVVLALDPSNPADRSFISNLSESVSATLLLLVPSLEPDSVAEGLRCGADLWLTDGDGREVFDSQIGAIRRRLEGHGVAGESQEVIVSGPLRIDPRAYRVTLNDEPVALTPLEFRMLAFLVRNAGRVVSSMELLKAQDATYPEQQAKDVVKVHIRRIRHKLNAVYPGYDFILNVRGVGYFYDPPAPANVPIHRLPATGAQPTAVASG